MSDSIVDRVMNILREGDDSFRVSTATGKECCVVGGRNFCVKVGDIVVYRLTNPTISPPVVVDDASVGNLLLFLNYSGGQQYFFDSKTHITITAGSFYAPVRRS